MHFSKEDNKMINCHTAFLQELSRATPATPLLNIYSKELKKYVHTKICTHSFIATLFIVAKLWEKTQILPNDK